jgi:hypothetical protein
MDVPAGPSRRAAAGTPPEAMRRILWDKWSEDDIGEHQFIGRLFDDRGQIYRGCTAFDAARYTLQRLAALGGELRSVHKR